jgi:hypothetical protein
MYEHLDHDIFQSAHGQTKPVLYDYHVKQETNGLNAQMNKYNRPMGHFLSRASRLELHMWYQSLREGDMVHTNLNVH